MRRVKSGLAQLRLSCTMTKVGVSKLNVSVALLGKASASDFVLPLITCRPPNALGNVPDLPSSSVHVPPASCPTEKSAETATCSTAISAGDVNDHVAATPPFLDSTFSSPST